MHISFKKVILHNFLSFGHTEVDLDNSSYTLVSGVNNCKADLARSNGSGKSSLWESIIWCLTGETIRGTKDILNKYQTDGAYIELLFNIDQDEYKIIRYKEYSNIGTNLKVYINNEDKSGKGIRDTEKLLEQYLPDITSDLIGSVIILGQGLPQRFTNNTPSGRKEVLEKLSKSDFMIQDIKNKLIERKDLLNGTINDKEKIILADNSKLSVYESQLVNLEKEKEQLVPEDFASLLIDLEMKIKEDEEQIDKLQEDKSKVSLELSLSETKYKNVERELESKKHELIKQFNINLQPLIQKETELQTEIKSTEKEIIRLESIKDICPTCGQKLPDVHKVDTTSLRNNLIIFKTKLDIVQSNKKEQQEKDEETYNSLIDKYFKELDVLINELKEFRTQECELVPQINVISNNIQTNKIELEKVKLRRDNYENKIKTIDKDIEDAKTQISLLKDKVLYNNIEKDKLRDHYDVVNKMLTIATRDFRGFLLSEVIKFINQKAKEYCKEIFDTEEVEFKLDGNNIFIGYCGKQYENLSGGEKQKIDLIVQFSIRDMLSQFLNFSSNILVLDEIFDNLDNIGCQRVLNLISNKLIDINSIFIITHHGSELDIPYDKELIIVKDDSGISKVEY